MTMPRPADPSCSERSRTNSLARFSVWLLFCLGITGCARISVPSPQERVVAVANLGAPAQTVDHFAASDAWSMQHVGLWSDTNRNLVADLLFTTNRGIGLSAWRFNLMAGFDPTVSPGTKWQFWRTGNGFNVDSNQYDWDRQAGQRWFLGAAKSRGVDRFFAMAYGPYTNFTRNGQVYCTPGLGSSNLKPGHEQVFAQSIADVIAHFQTDPVASERIEFDYVLPVNEPQWEWNGNSQEGSRYSNADIIALSRVLRQELDTRSLHTEIVLAESGDLRGLYELRDDISTTYQSDYGNYLNSLACLTNIVSRHLTGHSYFTDNPSNDLLAVRRKLKKAFSQHPYWDFWQTEYCIMGPGGSGRDLGIDTALNVARVMWADLVLANAGAWHWWLAVSQADYKDGLLYTDFWKPGDPESIYCSKTFWAFGQFSRFVRPGWRRVTMPGLDDVHGLMGAAFVSPQTNSAALVFVNHSKNSCVVVPRLHGLSPGQKISSWTPWVTSGSTSDNLSARPPFSGGASFSIPRRSVVTLVADVTAEFSAVPRPIRVLAIGDSITVGYTDNPRWTAPFEFGYRAELFKMLKHADIPVEFVGNSREPWNGLWKVPTNSPAPDLRLLEQDCHEGYGAKATAFVAEHIQEWVRTNRPDFILLMIGINDIPAGATNASEAAKSNLELIAERVAATSPSTHLIMAQTIPYTRPTPAILDLNRFIRETLVPDCTSRGMRISTVDQCRNFLAEPAGSTGDPALYSNGYNHPNAEGYRRMAQTWCEEIRRLVHNRRLAEKTT